MLRNTFTAIIVAVAFLGFSANANADGNEFKKITIDKNQSINKYKEELMKIFEKSKHKHKQKNVQQKNVSSQILDEFDEEQQSVLNLPQ